MPMKLNINSQQFKEWALDNRDLALAVCQAQAAALVVRDKVDSYIKPIFESFQFTYCGPLAERLDRRAGPKFLGTPLKYEDLHLCDDPRLPDFFDACYAAHLAHGYDDLPKGHCPALQVESLLIAAQGALIQAAEPIAGIKRYMLVARGIEKEYLDLLIGACVAGATDEEINRYITPPLANQQIH